MRKIKHSSLQFLLYNQDSKRERTIWCFNLPLGVVCVELGTIIRVGVPGVVDDVEVTVIIDPGLGARDTFVVGLTPVIVLLGSWTLTIGLPWGEETALPKIVKRWFKLFIAYSSDEEWIP